MSRREAREIAPDGVDIDAPRAKRRRAEGPVSSTTSDKSLKADPDASKTVKDEAADAATKVEDPEEVKQKGISLWQSVKDAVSKDGRSLSYDFLRLPSKRQYPDYYQLIKRPISLDEIKTQLDNGLYATLEDVKLDLELCFKNAKRYNMRDSQIWKDAKLLHKQVLQDYSKITGTDDAGEAEEISGEIAGSDDEGAKKKKTPSMYRVLKQRLQKLIEKTDESGRVLSSEFMELPNRKQWPIYYKAIKKPQCLENVFKRLKRKEYHASQDFANDVELVFSNALEFNQEHTEIWDDAMVLRDYFRLIMSDLPEPFTIPAYKSNHASEQPTKLKLKVPAQAPAPTPVLAPAPASQQTSTPPLHSTPASVNNLALTAGGRLLLHVPAQQSTPQSNAQSSSPGPRAAALPAATDAPATSSPMPIPTSSSFVPPQGSTPPIPTGQLQPATFTPSTTGYNTSLSQHHSSSPYQTQPVTTITPSTTTSSLPAPVPAHVTRSTRIEPATSISPSPSLMGQYARQLKRVWLEIKPLGRRLELDYRDGVRTWAVQLSAQESTVQVSRMVFRGGGGEDQDSSDEDDEMDGSFNAGQQLMEEEEEEEPEEPKVKRRGRGRPSKKDKEREMLERENAALRAKGKARARALSANGVQVKLNGALVIKGANQSEGWECQIPVGLSVLEVGEKGGPIWRVHLSRTMMW